MKLQRVVIEPPRTDSRIFAHTRWDAIPVCAALLHCAYFFALFYLFPRAPLWVMLILGLISIYRHGHHGEAEHPLRYMFLSFFREDPKTVYRELKRRNPSEAFWGVAELALFVCTFVVLGILNWRYICFLLPFW